jgi:hypothetical protein
MRAESPLVKAGAVREQIKDALNYEVPLILHVDTKTSSFLMGLPIVSLEQLSGKSLIIDGQKGFQTLILNTTAENAKQLFIRWSENSDPDLQKSFIIYAYDHLYAFAQAGNLGIARQLALGAHGLILDALADTGRSEYRFLEGMREYVEGKGAIEEEDKKRFQELLVSLWEKMDGLDRADRFLPRLAFQGR